MWHAFAGTAAIDSLSMYEAITAKWSNNKPSPRVTIPLSSAPFWATTRDELLNGVGSGFGSGEHTATDFVLAPPGFNESLLEEIGFNVTELGDDDDDVAGRGDVTGKGPP